MKRGGGKSKGSGFEREICKKLSLWWSEGTRKDLCWRTASSGAVGTITKTKTAAFYGDISAVDSSIQALFDKFCFELKCYKEIDIMEMFKDKKGNVLLGWWKQTVKEGVQSKRVPILVFKVNHYPEMLVCTDTLFFGFNILGLINKKIKFISIGHKLVLCRLDDALNALCLAGFKKWLLPTMN